jgi:hypothetical protein
MQGSSIKNILAYQKIEKSRVIRIKTTKAEYINYAKFLKKFNEAEKSLVIELSMEKEILKIKGGK